MARQARIVLVAADTPDRARTAGGLRAAAFDVAPLDGPDAAVPADATGAGVDLVLIDAATQAMPDAVSACRRRWAEGATPVLVVNAAGPSAAAAAIDAGAADALPAAADDALLVAHVRRVLRWADTLRQALDDARDRLHRQCLARAAADVAVPLGELVDGLEAIVNQTPAEAVMDQLLDRVGRAMDAVERLRRQADPPPPGGT